MRAVGALGDCNAAALPALGSCGFGTGFAVTEAYGVRFCDSWSFLAGFPPGPIPCKAPRVVLKRPKVARLASDELARIKETFDSIKVALGGSHPGKVEG